MHEDGLASLGRSEQGPLVGIDAAHFLERFRHPSKEPLVPALGGFPMALEALIAKQVRVSVEDGSASPSTRLRRASHRLNISNEALRFWRSM